MYINDLTLTPLVVAEPGGLYNSSTNENQWVEVLVDCAGAPGLFVYRLPQKLQVKPGDIVSVPFGAQILGGIAIRLIAQLPEDLPPQKIREVEDVVSAGFFRATYWELLNRVAAYYYTPLIQVIRVALPPGLLGRSQRRIRLVEQKAENEKFFWSYKSFLSPVGQQILELLLSSPTKDYSFSYLQRQVKGAYQGVKQLQQYKLVESYLEPPRAARPKLQKAVTLTSNNWETNLTARQQQILEVLRRRGGELWYGELLEICRASPSTLKALEQKGYIVIQQREVLRSETSGIQQAQFQEPKKILTPAQLQALSTIREMHGYKSVLLHGVTGSGKTEVYLQAIAPLLAQGKSALVLVPEIGLTPQLTDRFRARFSKNMPNSKRASVVVYHSALSDGERYDSWRQMLTGEPQVVIGTRSAVFAPLPNLGLIILDEEHDSSFKQDSPVPTYHARTVAQWRAQLENIPLVLGSATPSVESWFRFKHQEQQKNSSYYLSLPERINSRPLPPVEVVDMRQEFQQGNRSIFSKSLQKALQELKQRNQQGILFIHRRGHSTFVSCRHCGYVLECPHCDVSLSYHYAEENAPQILRCHYCNYKRSHPRHCPECGSPYLKFFGCGTQRVAQELTRQFPQLRFIRFDSDTTRTKGAHRTLLSKFTNQEADLLVGTQMLAKGLDLPQVTLVGVVAADGLLHLSDYRASERAFQILTQVAGRAGRGEDPGKAIIQTYTPEHPVIAAVRNHDYDSFIETELQQRQALNYPPYGRLILLRLSGLDATQVETTANAVATALAPQHGLEILGPAPASILRLANRYRWQILLKLSPDVLPGLPDWEQLRQLCPSSVSLTIDVDPLNIMY